MFWLFIGLVLVGGAVGVAVARGADFGLSAGLAAAGVVVCLLSIEGYDTNDPEAQKAVLKAFSSPAALADAFAAVIGFVPTVAALFIGVFAGYQLGKPAASAQ